jgi:hypothetical protein
MEPMLLVQELFQLLLAHGFYMLAVVVEALITLRLDQLE